MRRSRFVQLLTARRFAPLFITQFLEAFNDGFPRLFVRRSIKHVSSVPLLGTGKIDYVSVTQLASARALA